MFEARHCEEQRDEAIPLPNPPPLAGEGWVGAPDCFAELVIGAATLGRTRRLAMTILGDPLPS